MEKVIKYNNINLPEGLELDYQGWVRLSDPNNTDPKSFSIILNAGFNDAVWGLGKLNFAHANNLYSYYEVLEAVGAWGIGQYTGMTIHLPGSLIRNVRFTVGLAGSGQVKASIFSTVYQEQGDWYEPDTLLAYSETIDVNSPEGDEFTFNFLDLNLEPGIYAIAVNKISGTIYIAYNSNQEGKGNFVYNDTGAWHKKDSRDLTAILEANFDRNIKLRLASNNQFSQISFSGDGKGYNEIIEMENLTGRYLGIEFQFNPDGINQLELGQGWIEFYPAGFGSQLPVADQILDKIVSILSLITTDNGYLIDLNYISRLQKPPSKINQYPAVVVGIINDKEIGNTTQHSEKEMTLGISGWVKSDKQDEDCNILIAEIKKALLSNPQLDGLAIDTNITEERVFVESIGYPKSQPLGRIELDVKVRYRTKYNNPYQGG